MFFFKKKNTPAPSKQTPIEVPEAKSENVAKKGIKTMDTVVTGVILGGIIASLYGVKKLKSKDKESHPAEKNISHDIHK